MGDLVRLLREGILTERGRIQDFLPRGWMGSPLQGGGMSPGNFLPSMLRMAPQMMMQNPQAFIPNGGYAQPPGYGGSYGGGYGGYQSPQPPMSPGSTQQDWINYGNPGAGGQRNYGTGPAYYPRNYSRPEAGGNVVRPGPGAAGGAAPSSMAGGTFAQKAPGIMQNLMRDFGLTDYQAAAIVGNIGHETGGFKYMQELQPRGGRGGLGWAQWTGPRRRDFENYTSQNNLDPRSDEANYGFLKSEIASKYGSTLDQLKQTKNPQDAMVTWEHGYEGAGVKAYDSRMNFTNQALQAYNSTQGQQPSRQNPQNPQTAQNPQTGQNQIGGNTHPVDEMVSLAGKMGPELRQYLLDPAATQYRDPSKGKWCAEFVNAYLAHAGLEGTGSLMARSFADYGTGAKLQDVQKGDVLVNHDLAHVSVATGRTRINPQTGQLEVEAMSSNSLDANGRLQNSPGLRWRSDVDVRHVDIPTMTATNDQSHTGAAAGVQAAKVSNASDDQERQQDAQRQVQTALNTQQPQQTPSNTQQTASNQRPLAIGDSLAVGVGGIYGNTDYAHGGWNPQAVSGLVDRAIADGAIKGRPVVLSGGASNAGGDSGMVAQYYPQMITKLQNAGASSVHVMGVGPYSHYDNYGYNKIIGDAASQAGVHFTGPLANIAPFSGNDYHGGIHPNDYRPIVQHVETQLAQLPQAPTSAPVQTAAAQSPDKFLPQDRTQSQTAANTNTPSAPPASTGSSGPPPVSSGAGGSSSGGSSGGGASSGSGSSTGSSSKPLPGTTPAGTNLPANPPSSWTDKMMAHAEPHLKTGHRRLRERAMIGLLRPAK